MRAKPKKIDLKNVIWKEGKYYVAWNLNTAVSSFGETREEARDSLREALSLHLEAVPARNIAKVERPDFVSFALSHA